MSDIKVINDPIYDTIYFNMRDDLEGLVYDLIQTRPFQRLRRIKQLGLANLVFPSVTHDRFSHSLGVFHLARRWCRYATKYLNCKITDKDRQAFQLAALLHDIGHGPISHTFEALMRALAKNSRDKKDKNYFKHEHYTVRLIKERSEISELITKKLGNSTKNAVVDLISNSKKLAVLLDGQLDIDRLDYLARDSHYAGVKYGMVDIDRMMWCSILKKSNRSYQIYFKDKSADSIRHYLACRYFMYKNVYMHSGIKSAELQLINIFKCARDSDEPRGSARRAKGGGKNVPCRKNDSLLKRLFDYDGTSDFSLDDYLEMDDAWLMGLVNEWASSDDKSLAKLCKEYCNRSYPKLKQFNASKPQEKKIRRACERELGNRFLIQELTPLKYYEPYNEAKSPIQMMDDRGNAYPLTSSCKIGVEFIKPTGKIFGLSYPRKRKSVENKVVKILGEHAGQYW